MAVDADDNLSVNVGCNFPVDGSVGVDDNVVLDVIVVDGVIDDNSLSFSGLLKEGSM